MDRPLLSAPRLRLRPLDAGDLDAVHALWTDPGVRRYLWDDLVIPREQAAAVITASEADFARHGYGLWAVCLPETGELIGFCGFRRSEEGEPELLYGLAPAWWGRGLATEASRAALDYGFETLGFERVVAATDVPNADSVRVMERLGMRFERPGELNGLDTLFYSLSREEWASRRKA